MYNHGNYSTQFGNNPERPPRPQFPFQPSGHTLQPPLQQGPVHPPPPPLIQQARPQDCSSYLLPSSAQTPINLSVSSMPSSGQPYINPHIPVHGRTSTINPYTMSHQNLQSPSQMGSQRALYPSPSPPSIDISRFPHPPLPSLSQAMYGHLSHQPLSKIQQNVPHMPPQRPPSTIAFVSSSLLTSVPPPPLLSSDQSLPPCPPSSSPSQVFNLAPPPARPNDAMIVRNIGILCQYISMNGPQFEDMARQKEAGNPKFNFLLDGGEPGSDAAVAHEYYLWMKKKSCRDYHLRKGQSTKKLDPAQVEFQSSRQPSNNTEGALCSLSDSDMEMEDDITCPESEQIAGSNPINGQSGGPVPGGGEAELHKQVSSLYYLGDQMQKARPLTNSVDDDSKIPDKASIHIIESDMPLRLIEEYASEQNNKAYASGSSPISVSPRKILGAMTSDEDLMFCSPGPRTTGLELSEANQSVLECRAPEVDGEPANNNAGTKAPNLRSSEAFHEGEASVSSGAAGASESSKAEKEHVKRRASSKVDKFGRLIREGVGDSDSDDSHFTRRRGRRSRSRSYNHSRSPVDKRRRTSPLRRKERRSRSRSWSPRRRRNRSRSPVRRRSDFGNENFGRGNFQKGQCFNFLKGRCHQGASCRYIHDQSDKYDRSRHHRSRPHLSESGAGSRFSDFHEQNKDMDVRVSFDHDEARGEEMKLCQQRHSRYASKDAVDDEKDRAGASSRFSDFQEQNKDMDVRVSSDHDEAMFEEMKLRQHRHSQYASKGAVDEEKDRTELLNYSAHQSVLDQDNDVSVADQSNNTIPEESNNPLRKTVTGVVSDFPTSRLDDDEKFSEDHAVRSFNTEVSAQLHPALDNHHQVRQTNASSSKVAAFPNNVSQSSPPSLLLQGASVTSYLTSLPNQQPHCPAPQNPSWSNLPSQYPFPPYANPPIPGAPAQFQPNDMPVRIDSMNQTSLKSNPSDFPSQSQIGASQNQTYADSNQPQMHVEDFRNTALDPMNPLSKPAEVSNFPTSVLPSSLYAPGNIPTRPGTHQSLPYLHHQLSSYGPYQTAGDTNTIPSQAGGSLSGSTYFSEVFPSNHTSYHSDLGSRIAPHFSPYASKFDQPLSSKFSSTIQRQEEIPYGSKYDTQFEGQNVGRQGASQTVVSPHSSRAGEQTLARSGGDQYDPLYDSIEPSSVSFKKNAYQQDVAADNSDIMLRLSDTRNPSDVEENNKSKNKEVSAAETSEENDGFGETAEAESGAMGSPSPSNCEGDEAAGETDIYHVKKEGKSKKSKDSRSMKLFKAELANFVKEILKPSWRQGNMSKEAFKTIVKKTVDKVSGAMKGRRVPKSKDKINRYIDSSQRKLTQLVEGYVNKYAKA